MKKSVALAIAAAMSLSIAGTALAQNPFSDVPQGHWAYEAIAQLEKDGLITGYGDGTYRGDRAMSRYEMATVVAQLDDANGENAEMISRLRSEFATELYNLGVRVDRLEKNASTIKFNGDGHIRYQSGGTPPLNGLKGEERKSTRYQQRIRINMTADINEKVKFLGRLRFGSTINRKSSIDKKDAVSWTHDTYLDRAEVQWNNGSFQGRFGRILPTLGQGLIWFNACAADGALVGYKTKKWDIFGGVLDYRPTDPAHGDSTGSGDAARSKNATVAHIGYKFNDRFGMTAAYSNAHASESYYPFDLMAFGFDAKLSKDWRLTAEYIKNNADQAKDEDQDTGYWARINYKRADMNKKGSFSIYAEYMDIEKYAVDSDTYGHILEFSAGRGYGAGVNPPVAWQQDSGAKGYGIGITYVVAKNINFNFTYHDMETTTKPNKDYHSIYQFITNFKF